MEPYIDKPKFINEEEEEPKNENNEDIEAPPSIAQSQSSVSSQSNNKIHIMNNITIHQNIII